MVHCWDVELIGSWLKKFASGSTPLKFVCPIKLGQINLRPCQAFGQLETDWNSLHREWAASLGMKGHSLWSREIPRSSPRCGAGGFEGVHKRGPIN